MPPKKIMGAAELARDKARKEEAKRKTDGDRAAKRKETAKQKAEQQPSAIDKLKIQMAKAKKALEKKNDFIAPIKKRTTFVPTRDVLATHEEEDDKLRAFLTKSLELDSGEFIEAIKRYIYKGKLNMGKRIFFDNLFESLPPKYIRKFFSAYAENTEKNVEDFYKSYIKKADVALAIKKMFAKADEEYTELAAEKREQEKLKRLIASMAEEGDVVEEDDESFPAPPPKGRKSSRPKRVDRSPVNKNPLSPGSRMGSLKICISMYSKPPWVEGYVKRVYIAHVNGGSSIKPFIIADSKKVIGDTTWYIPSKAYYRLQCNQYSRTREQEGDVLVVMTEDKSSIQLHVGYETNRGFQVQNEAMFEKEIAHLNEIMLTTSQKIVRLMEGPVMEESRLLAKHTLSSRLTTVAPNVSDYKDGSAYIDTVVEIMEKDSKNVKELATKVVGITAYLVSYIAGDGDSVFIKKLRKNEYTPQILTTLSQVEKLPEIFNNDKVNWEMQAEVDNYISYEEHELFQAFGLRLYDNIHIQDHVPTRAQVFPPRTQFKLDKPYSQSESDGAHLDWGSSTKSSAEKSTSVYSPSAVEPELAPGLLDMLTDGITQMSNGASEESDHDDDSDVSSQASSQASSEASSEAEESGQSSSNRSSSMGMHGRTADDMASTVPSSPSTPGSEMSEMSEMSDTEHPAPTYCGSEKCGRLVDSKSTWSSVPDLKTGKAVVLAFCSDKCVSDHSFKKPPTTKK
jgi:hypothetical protein